jgi:hypothetical protein
MWLNLLIKSALFIALVPGVILRIPQGASPLTQALVHGIVFALVNWYLYKYVISQYENFEMPDSRVLPPCPPGSVRHGKDCRMKGEGEAPY